MKIWTISDLHLRQRDALDLLKPGRLPEADVCVLAGDACDRFNLSLNWAAKVIAPKMPVVFVMGNHEFYAATLSTARQNAAFLGQSLGIHVLDDREVEIGGVRFIGSSLWTNFALFGADDHIAIYEAMNEARRGMVDYGEIRVVNGDVARQMKPQDTIDMHRASLSFLESAFEIRDGRKTVVVTHHAPHRNSIHARYAKDPVTPAFVSDLSAEIGRWQPDLWVHGHVHSPFDYMVGRTRIVCNPKGYRNENPDFDFMKVVEI